MADEATPKPAEADHLDPYERKYFATRGESDIPAEKPAPDPDKPSPSDAPKGPIPSTDNLKAADTGKPEQTTVPQAALHEERKRRQEAEEKARQMELLNARMEERFRTFRDTVAPRQQQPAAPPSPDQDIFGAVRHLQGETTRQRQEIDGYKQQIQQENQLKRLNQWAADTVSVFLKQAPDYFEAYKHLRGSRARELQVWGMQPSAISEQLAREENQLIARAAAERRNPAQMVYDLARERGYQKGAAQAPAPGAASKHEVDMNLQRIEAGQKQSGSLSTVGGGAGGRNVDDIEGMDVLKMSDKEFEAYMTKYPGHWRRLKGASH